MRKVSKSEPKGAIGWPLESKGSQEGADGSPKGAKGHQKAKREPKGAKREPKVSQNQHKINIKVRVSKRSRKGCQNSHRIIPIWEPFGSHIPSKIEEQTNAKIDAEKVMKFNEQSMRTLN